MSNNNDNTATMDLDLAVADLGPLAWVSEELRKSLDAATKALRRFARDAQSMRGTDLAAIDTSQLRIARTQLHQAVGALEMVGFNGPCILLHAMENAVAHFVDKPQNCTDQAAQTVELASFAVMEYLDATIASRAQSPVALFPQFKDIQTLAGQTMVHPADLWGHVWRWTDLAGSVPASQPLAYDAAARSQLDQSILAVMRGNFAEGGRLIADVAQGLAACETRAPVRAYWQIVAALGQALQAQALKADIYLKRALPSVVQQFVALGKSVSEVPERAGRDLLFFCAQADASKLGDQAYGWYRAVAKAYRLGTYKPVDYEKRIYGNYDPAVLGTARKTLAAFKETWSSFSGGDAAKSRTVQDQCQKVAEALVRLYPAGQSLAEALRRTTQTVSLSQSLPSAEVAMEVATAILFLEMVFEDFDQADQALAERTQELAKRLALVDSGAASPPLLSWMEDLYRRFSEHGTLGSVVGELRTSLSELEKNLDLYFRDPSQQSVLADAPARLTQMRGVMSVLGLDQAVLAVVRMRDWVEEILKGNVSHQAASVPGGYFEKIGISLGALGFQFDMLGYQPSLAKKLFEFDAQSGELKPVMGRAASPDLVLGNETDSIEPSPVAHQAAVIPQAPVASAPAVVLPVPIPVTQEPDVEEDDLLDIFLEEAREVIEQGQQAISNLRNSPADMELRTTLRRSFHTLKGSSRMVGLSVFGEAAWAMEQAHNASLADPGPCTADLLNLSEQVLAALALWAQRIADHGVDAPQPSAAPFKTSADALRLDGRYLPLDVPELRGVEPVPSALETIEIVQTPPTDSGAAELVDLPEVTQDFVDLTTDLQSASSVQAHSQAADIEFLLDDQTPAPSFEATVPAEFLSEEPASPTESSQAVMTEPDLDFSFDLSDEKLPEQIIVEEGQEASAQQLPELQEQQPIESLVVADSKQADFSDISFDLTDIQAVEAQAMESGQELAASVEFDLELPTPSNFDQTQVLDLIDTPGEPEPALPLDALDLPGLELDAIAIPEVTEIPASTSEPEPAPQETQDNVKIIGDLQINLALYNVYLSEADEWSRQLLADITETSLDTYAMPSDDSVAWAHSLAGSSATVGFESLSALSRELEYALIQSQRQGAQTPQLMQLFIDAAEAIRRSLHQFAAGLMPKPETELVEQLREAQTASVASAQAVQRTVIAFPDVTKTQSAAQSAATESQAVASVSSLADAGAAPSEFELPELSEPTAAAASTASLAHSEDEFDVVDAIDQDLFPIFEEEAAELLPNLGAALRQWVARADNYGARSEALRLMHTLKGSARLAGALRLGEMIHQMESDVEHLGSSVTAAQLEPLVGGFDRISEVFEALRARDAQVYQQALDNTRAGAQTATVAPVVSSHTAQPETQPEAPAASANAVVARPVHQAPRVVMPSSLVARSSNQSVRVRSNLLDRMVNQAGEVMMTRSRLEAELGNLRGSLTDLTSNLDKLRQQLRDIELQAETQMQSRMAQSRETQANFDPLEFDRYTRVQELTRMMAESVNDVATVQRNLDRALQSTEDNLMMQARQTRELQGDLLRTRMVEFEGISERLYRVVRLASKETGKQVRLDITGGQIEMDRGMLDRLAPAFEHLLRNCVAHGIEDSAVRQMAGKDAAGLISITLSQEGNDVNVEFRDDGAGLNLERIREKAVSLGMLPAHSAITPAQAADFIFAPGFSTATEVTELAGRGIGMDVVRNEIIAIGGRIDTTTEQGKGTSFKLVLPLTTAVTQVVMIRSGDLIVGVPSTLVEIVRRTAPRELEMAYNSGQLEVVEGDSIPFFWSGALLQSSARSLQPAGRSTPVMIFRSAAQRVALHVDEVLGNQEVVVKNLGAQLSRLPGLAGMSLLPTGAVVLIYNPVALAAVYGQQARSLSADQAEPHLLGEVTAVIDAPTSESKALTPVIKSSSTLAQTPLVLVVDDSITVRKVTQRLLQREGYRVALAADGLQALEKLSEEIPSLVLSDIEMPRMDGFDLARNIRNDAKTRHLPIIMITSRIAEKHREHAQNLGVDHYLGKPFSEEELLSLVKRYCMQEATV